MVNDQQQNILKHVTMATNPFFTKTLYLWGKYMILIEIMLTSNTYCL